MALKVAINGYGTIGKRVADAVALQDDMEIIGVTKRRPTFEAKMAVKNGYPFYAADQEFVKGFEEENIPVLGTLKDLLQEADIVLDCTPKKSGYKAMYEEANQLIHDRVIGVPVVHRTPPTLMRANIEGYIPSPVREVLTHIEKK